MTQRMLTYNAVALVKVPQPFARRNAPLGRAGDPAPRVADEHRLGPLVGVSLMLGLRVGDVCGLSWADVDLAGQVLRVRKQADVAGKCPLFDVSRILGHSEIGTTADVYGHLVDEMTASAAARMDRLLSRTKA